MPFRARDLPANLEPVLGRNNAAGIGERARPGRSLPRLASNLRGTKPPRTKRFVCRPCPTGGRGVRQDMHGRVCSPFSIASFRPSRADASTSTRRVSEPEQYSRNWGARPPRAQFDAPRVEPSRDETTPHQKVCPPPLPDWRTRRPPGHARARVLPIFNGIVPAWAASFAFQPLFSAFQFF
jgi:hypothetical protein